LLRTRPTAREKAERAINEEFKADFLAAESRRITFALSYEQHHRLSRTIAGFDRRRTANAITGMLRQQGVTFDLDDITRLTIAYHAVLYQLDVVAQEDGATLLVTKRIVDLASQGERDPERLTAAIVEALSK
jgi:hypothetical protein